MRILITGSRHWTDRTALASAMSRALTYLGSYIGANHSAVLVHGGAKGADAVAADIADNWGWTVEEHPADWDADGRRAGPLRNQRMVDAGADIVLACPMPGSKGTWDCMKRAVEAGIPVYIVNTRERT